MHSLMEEEEGDIHSPTTPDFGLHQGYAPAGQPGGDGTGDYLPALKSAAAPEGYPAQYNFGRRTSVSAESLKPVADTFDNWTPPVHHKSQQQLERLQQSITGNFVFSHLDDEQSAQILGALVEKPIPAQGIKVSHLVAVFNTYLLNANPRG